MPTPATPDGGQWTELGSCTSGQYCTQEVSPADAAKKIAVCKDVQSPVSDTVGAGDSAAAGDSKGPSVTEMKTCVMSKCSTEWTACKADTAGCALMANCLEKCSDEACVDACPKVPDNNSQALALGMCMLSKGCAPSQPDVAVCGNGKCEEIETNASCAKDCPATAPVCGNNKCDPGETTASCAKDCPATTPVCGNNKCDPGETTASCAKDCPSTTPVCGNGKCDPGETSTSCLKDCPTSGPVCGDKKCETNEIEMCPTDCIVCGNGKCESGETTANCKGDCPATTTAKCGDGKCGSGESCPMDCSTSYGPTIQCGWSSCASAMTACAANKDCVDFFNCAASCTNCSESCLQACVMGPGIKAQSQLTAVSECAQAAECPNPCPNSVVCGNGKCESGETKTNCSKDCGTATMCGNGVCETGETKTNCAPDCGGTTTGHPCDSACGGQAPGGGCYCDAACIGAGDCCGADGKTKAKSCSPSTCGACNPAP